MVNFSTDWGYSMTDKIKAELNALSTDIDSLAQVIRTVDGDHSLGAGALAEAILESGWRPSGQVTVSEDQINAIADHIWNQLIGAAKTVVREEVSSAARAAGIRIEGDE